MRSDLWTLLAPLSLGPAIGSPGGTHPFALFGDQVYAAWQWAGHLYLRRSADAGRTWGEPQQVTTSPTAEYPVSLEASESALHLFWPDNRHGSWELWYRRSEDGGDSWSEEQRLEPEARLFRYGTALSREGLHAAWMGNCTTHQAGPHLHTWGEIYYKRSADAGLTWEPTIRLTAPEATAGRPAVAAAGRTVHVAYYDRRDGHFDWDWDLYYRRSLDGGRSWEPELRLTHTPTHVRHPAIVADAGGHVCCLWEDGQIFDAGRVGGDAALYAAVSEDAGATWGPTRRLTFTGTPHSHATHSKSYAYGSRVHLAWADAPPGQDWQGLAAYYMTSPDCGLSWSEPERLTDPGKDGPSYADGVVGKDDWALVSCSPGEGLWYRRRELPQSGE